MCIRDRYKAAYDSGVVVIAKRGGTVTAVDAESIEITVKKGDVDRYELIKVSGSNQDTCIKDVYKRQDLCHRQLC